MATPSQWIAGARPRTLPAAVVPVAVGTGVAIGYDGAVWWRALLALFVALALQVGVNYANDYSDGVRGTDDERVGPMRLVGSGRRRPVRSSRRLRLFPGRRGGGAGAGRGHGGLVAAPGGCGVDRGGLVLHRRPGPYGYRALGEISVFVFFGLVAVAGTTFVQLEYLPWPAWRPRSRSVGYSCRTCQLPVGDDLDSFCREQFTSCR